VDVIVLGGMGLKHDDYLFFRDTAGGEGALARAVLFVHTASDPVVECLMVPDLALAVAEQFALQNKRVLVLLTDMTNFADALKEIAITMEQIPPTAATRATSTASWPRATRRRSTSTPPAPSRSWR
jgi:V/A-type H+-transporting ATPase subunit B